MNQYDAIIVGGGITGLAAAHWLTKLEPTWRVVLVEKSARLGGKIGTERRDGFVVEAGPDCFLSRKPRGAGLSQELGIDGKLMGRRPEHKKTFVLRNGRLHHLPEGLTGMIPTNLDALRQSTLLSDEAAARVAAEPTIAPLDSEADESVASFVTRRLGQETFENLIEPLMGGIYAGQASKLSILATFPQLRALEATQGSLLRGLENRPTPATSELPPFVSFEQGMGTLVEAIVAELDSVDVLLETAVTSIGQAGELATVNCQLPMVNEDRTLAAPVVILAAPAFAASEMVGDWNEELADLLGEIEYASSVLVNFAFDEEQLAHGLDGYGYVIPLAEGKEALACTWTSRKWGNRAPEGKVLLRVYIGRFGQPDVAEYDDERLIRIAREELRATLGIEAAPEWSKIFRWPRGLPQFNLGHLERLERVKTAVSRTSGLFLAGAYFNGVGIPDCIGSGEQAAKQAVAHVRDRKSLAVARHP